MSIDFFRIKTGIGLGSLSSAPSSPVNGEIYYNSTSNQFQLRQNGAWVDIPANIQTQIDGKVSKSGDTMTGALVGIAGTASAPSFSFSGDTDSGFFSAKNDCIAWSLGGVRRGDFRTNGSNGGGILLNNDATDRASIRASVSASGLDIFGGTTTSNGAALRLYGNGDATSPGTAQIWAGGSVRITVASSGSTTFSSPVVISNNGAPNFSIFRDTNAGDSTNINAFNIGNSGASQGIMSMQWANAAASASPSFRLSFQPRNNANSTQVNLANLYLIKDAAADTATIRSGASAFEVYTDIAATTTRIMRVDSAGALVTGNITINTAGGGLYVKEGSNATMGSVTLTAGGATVNTTKVTATSRIFLTSQVDGGTVGFLRVSARSAGTSFTITSSSGTDTSTVAWFIVEPA